MPKFLIRDHVIREFTVVAECHEDAEAIYNDWTEEEKRQHELGPSPADELEVLFMED